MKKLLFIWAVFFLSLPVNSQQTEDEVYVGKKYGNYKGTGIIIPDTDRKVKPVNRPTAITGIAVTIGWCEEDCLTILVKKDNGTTITVGTRDYGFTVPKKLEGKKIIVEGIDAGQISGVIKNREVKKDYQKNIQFAASGILVID